MYAKRTSVNITSQLTLTHMPLSLSPLLAPNNCAIKIIIEEAGKLQGANKLGGELTAAVAAARPRRAVIVAQRGITESRGSPLPRGRGAEFTRAAINNANGS